MVFPLGDEELTGVIQIVVPDDAGYWNVGGSLAGVGQTGEFSISQSLETGTFRGHILDHQKKVGYDIKSDAKECIIHKKPLSALVCSIPRHRGPAAAAAAAGTGPQALVAPLLNSRATAAGVIYLDFDGETVIDPSWNSGVTIVAAPATIGTLAITTAQMTDVWNRVAEDFRPFNLNVTTDRAKYDAAPVGHRARCIITPTDSWYAGSAGGVAYLKSYRGPDDGWSSTIPCWCWNNSSTAIMAMTISHEVGHMMDLSHDGDVYNTYYAGHDTGTTGWGPLMGAPFTKPVTQWSKGEYPGANNAEDDFAIISATVAEPAFGNAYAPDDAGNTTATAVSLAFTSPINQTGMITNAADVDFYSFKSAGGAFSVTASPSLPEPNLDTQLELYDGTGTLMVTSVQLASSLGSSISATLTTAGTYYIAVRGRGRTGAGIIGYTNYGSAGGYTLTGSYVPLPEFPLIVEEPVSVSANQGTKVTLTAKVLSNSTVLYQWYKVVSGSDVKLVGKTATSLAFLSVQPADAGQYKLVATNKVGSSTSAVVDVDVKYKPIIRSPLVASKQTVASGTPVSYTVVADGTAPMTYQWKKNNVVMAGETAATLDLGAVDWFDGGAYYTVVVTNALGSTTSVALTLTVTSAPIFSKQPLPVGETVKPIALGGTGSVTVQAIGTATILYQWFKDGLPLAAPNYRAVSYAWAATKLTAEGTYFVRASNASGYTDSASFTVDVQDRPVVDVSPPATVTLSADQPLSLDCAAHGTETLRYQWQLNGKDVADSAGPLVVTGATTPNLRIPNVSWLHKGTWRCVVTNAVGIAYSKNTVVNVNSYPVILTQPVGIKIAKNGTGVLKVVAGGNPVLKYQWYKDSVLIPGAVSSVLVLAKASVAATNGTYTVMVSNTQPLPSTGPVISAPAVVSVEDPPLAAAPSPLTQTVGVGDTVTITGNVTAGSPVLRFQWQKNNVDMVGETNQNLVLTNVQTTASALYRLKIVNDVGTSYSVAARVTVLIRPLITLQPVTQTIYEWDTVTFTTAATGSPTLLYQWYHDSVPIVGNASAKTNKLVITGARAAAAGQYAVVVTNAVGSVFSSDATLNVQPVPSPTLSDVRPTNVIVGSQMDIFGSNLQWTTGVNINGRAASFIKVRSNELIVTVPTGIAATGSLTVTTYGGTTTWPTPITWDKDGAENDDLINAKLMFGNNITAVCDNTRATYQSGDYYYGWGKSVWFRWRAPFTGQAAFTTFRTMYHNVCAVYSGPYSATSTSQLRMLSTFEDHFGASGGLPPYDTDTTIIDVTLGTEYYISVDCAHGDVGATYMRVVKYGAIPKYIAATSIAAEEGYVSGASLDGQQGWQAEGGGASVQAVTADNTDYVGIIGGHVEPGSSAVAASLSASDEMGGDHHVIKATADFNIHPHGDAEEQFSWALYDSDGMPLIALIFDNSKHGVITQVAGSDPANSGQVFVPGTSYQMGMEIDQNAGSWSVTLNNITIASGTGLLWPAGSVSHLAAGWKPANGSSTGGLMRFKNVTISYEEPESDGQEVR